MIFWASRQGMYFLVWVFCAMSVDPPRKTHRFRIKRAVKRAICSTQKKMCSFLLASLLCHVCRHTDTIDVSVVSKEPRRLSKEPYFWQKTGLQKEAYISITRVLCVTRVITLRKETYTVWKEPSRLSKEPYVLPKRGLNSITLVFCEIWLFQKSHIFDTKEACVLFRDTPSVLRD